MSSNKERFIYIQLLNDQKFYSPKKRKKHADVGAGLDVVEDDDVDDHGLYKIFNGVEVEMPTDETDIVTRLLKTTSARHAPATIFGDVMAWLWQWRVQQ